MQEHRSTGASFAGTWSGTPAWRRVDGVADGKLFARYPCAHTGWMVSQMANSLRGTRARMQDGWTTDGKLSARYPKTGWVDNRWQTLCEVREYKCGKVWIPRVSVHVVCARCLCTLSVHFICALHLCTLSVHVLVDSCREGSHRATRRRHACHLASPSCHRDHIEYSCHRIQLP